MIVTSPLKMLLLRDALAAMFRSGCREFTEPVPPRSSRWWSLRTRPFVAHEVAAPVSPSNAAVRHGARCRGPRAYGVPTARPGQ